MVLVGVLFDSQLNYILNLFWLLNVKKIWNREIKLSK